MALVLALASVVCYWSLVTVPIIILCMIITWRKTHNTGMVKMALTILAVAMLMILMVTLIIFVLYLFLSTVPMLLWIGVLLTAGFCLPLVFRCFAMVVQIWQQ